MSLSRLRLWVLPSFGFVIGSGTFFLALPELADADWGKLCAAAMGASALGLGLALFFRESPFMRFIGVVAMTALATWRFRDDMGMSGSVLLPTAVGVGVGFVVSVGLAWLIDRYELDAIE